jgi:hypothetical protein
VFSVSKVAGPSVDALQDTLAIDEVAVPQIPAIQVQ